MKKKTIAIGILGALLYISGIVSIVPPVPDSFDVVVWSRCVSDWDPIDGHRFGVGDVTWTTNEQHFRFTVTKNAYWPCSYSRTYITNANGSDVRTLEDDENIEWYIPANPDPFRGFYNSSTRQWSEDGAYYTYGVLGENGGVFISDAAEEDLRQVMDGVTDLHLLIWLPDNQRILIQASGKDDGIYLAHVERTKAKRLVKGLTLSNFYISPSGDKYIVWKRGFWTRNEFSVVVIDLDLERGFEVNMGGKLRELEERAEQECMPAECIEFDQAQEYWFWNIPIGMALMVLGLVLMVPGLWLRRDRLLAKVGLGFIGLHILGLAVIVIQIFI